MEAILTKPLVLRAFQEADYDDLYEFLSQLRDDEFEGNPIWKDTYVYAITAGEWDQSRRM